MKNKGFTLIELIIAIALLSIIMTAVITLFMIGLNNYQLETKRNNMQQDLNFVSDDISVQAKHASESPLLYESYTRGPETLILALPSIDENEDFIYEGNELLVDYFIYHLESSNLHKKIVASEQSTRTSREASVLDNVTAFNCLYMPQENTESINCTLKTNATVRGKLLNFEAQKTARLRNRR